MNRTHRNPSSNWHVKDCGVVTAPRKGAVGAFWMDHIQSVRVVLDGDGREALEIDCTMGGTAHVAIAKYVPAGVLPPAGLATRIATGWAHTKAEMGALK